MVTMQAIADPAPVPNQTAVVLGDLTVWRTNICLSHREIQIMPRRYAKAETACTMLKDRVTVARAPKSPVFVYVVTMRRISAIRMMSLW